MKTIVRSTEIDLTLTVEELAGCFASLSSDDMARFFNALSREVMTWPGAQGQCGGLARWALQLQYVIDSEELTTDGETVMAMMGEYGRAVAHVAHQSE